MDKILYSSRYTVENLNIVTHMTQTSEITRKKKSVQQHQSPNTVSGMLNKNIFFITENLFDL